MEKDIVSFVQRYLKKICFWFKLKRYRINSYIYNQNLMHDIYMLIVKILLKKIVLALILVSLAAYVDTLLETFFAIEYIAVNNNLMFNVIISGVGVAGVFIALYCDTIASIYSSKYASAPTSIVSLFENDAITNHAISLISTYIVFSFMLLVSIVFGKPIGSFSTLCFMLFTIYLITSFGLFGFRRNRLADTNSIALDPRQEILHNIKQVTCNSTFFHDSQFQYSFSQQSLYYLTVIEDIALFNIHSNINSLSMVEFTKQNNILLSEYWNEKIMIPYNSKWYRNKSEYEKWHFATDTEILIAIETGTFLPQKIKLNIFWFEEFLFKINAHIFSYLIKNNNWHDLFLLLANFNKMAQKAVNAHAVNYFFNAINQYHLKVLELGEKFFRSENKSEDYALADSTILEIFRNNTSIIVAVNEYLSKIDCNKILKQATFFTKYDEMDISKNDFLNNDDSKNLFNAIELECSIEGRKITSNWYVEQHTAHKVYDYLCEIAVCIDTIIDNSFNHVQKLTRNQLFMEAMCGYVSIIEMYNKGMISCNRLNSLLSMMQAKHIETTVIWKDNCLTSLKNKLITVYHKSIADWANCAILFYNNDKQEYSDYPDLLGGCYNYVCDDLIDSLCALDFDNFQILYQKLLDIVIVYQKFIKKDTDRIKESFKQPSAINVLVKPIVEYSEISGYAYIMGELVDEKWKNIVLDSVKIINCKLQSRSNDFYAAIINSCLFEENKNIGIYNRDVIETNWRTRIEQAIINKKLLKYKTNYNNPFHVNEIDTQSSLIKAFFDSGVGTSYFNKAFEVFLVMCVNKNVPDDKKFRSSSNWEQELNDNK